MRPRRRWKCPVVLNLPYRKAHAKYLMVRAGHRIRASRRSRDIISATDNVFFIVGHGRSGTQFLAHLLDQSANATVAHEPCVADIYAAQRARLETDFAAAYVRDYRRHRIVDWAERARPGLYGEVNSRLRHFIAPLQAAFPSAPILRLVRDGRDVVRSMLARDRWMIDVLAARAPVLGVEDPFVSELARMDDFARACWYWRLDTARSARQLPSFLRFEDFVSDPDYIMEHIVRPLGLDLSREVVVRDITSPKNSTKQHAVTSWRDWSSVQRETFWRLCGDLMEQHGYAR